MFRRLYNALFIDCPTFSAAIDFTLHVVPSLADRSAAPSRKASSIDRDRAIDINIYEDNDIDIYIYREREREMYIGICDIHICVCV